MGGVNFFVAGQLKTKNQTKMFPSEMKKTQVECFVSNVFVFHSHLQSVT